MTRILRQGWETTNSIRIYQYTYDAEGNVTAMSGGTAASYVYNALNQRVRTTVGSVATEFVFNSSGQRVSEWNPATQTPSQGKYYWGGKPVAYYTTTSNTSAPVGTHFEHQDWLGTERLRTSYNGSVEASFTSLPWGDGQSAAGADTDANHYAMLDHDAESDTDHAQFRQYSNLQGRFMSPDPYDGSYDLSNPQSLNRYVYAQNSPLGYVDPSGEGEISAGTGGLMMGCYESNGTGLSAYPVPCTFALGGNGDGGGYGGGGLFGVDDSDEPCDPNDPTCNPPSQACIQANIDAVNAASGLSITTDNIVGTPFIYKGALNLNFSVPGASASSLPAGRYPSSVFNAITGIGYSVHIPSPGGSDPSTYGMDSSGNFTFTSHIDSAYATWYTPIGVLIHYIVDVVDDGQNRSQCGVN